MSEWAIVNCVRCVVCPECAFTFDACHTDVADSEHYSCPVCAELEFEPTLKTLKDVRTLL